MDARTPPQVSEQLEAWLRYFDDLGLGSFYLDRVGAPGGIAGGVQTLVVAASTVAETAISESPTQDPMAKTKPKSPAAVAAKPSLLPLAATPANLRVQGNAQGPSLFEAAARVEGDTLERIAEDLGDDCQRCKLSHHRNKIVFGAGNPRAELVFVGEGPGHDEDLQGVPFVGRAGQLLTQMIKAMGLSREEVYIANVVKCRPPENRAPEKDEVAACTPFLFRQLGFISPKVIVALGATAAQNLLATNKSISHFRGQWIDFRGSKLMATYHPAYLLRNPNAKPEVWGDLKKVMTFLGLKAPRRD